MKQEIKKAVIIHSGALGDLIATLPALRALREKSGELIGVGSDRLKLLEYCGLFDRAVPADALGFHALFNDNFEPGPAIRELFAGADLAVSWMGRRSEVYQKNLERLAGKAIIFKEAFPPKPGSEHITRIMAQPVLEAGIEVRNFMPRLVVPAQTTNEGPGSLTLVVHPGSGSSKKALPLPKLFSILEMGAKALPDQKLGIITGEVEKTMVFEFVKRCPERLKARVQMISDLPLLRLADLLSRAKLYLGMDSGPTHLAAALGVKTVAIFGPTDPQVWAPPQEHVKVVAAKHECAPCADEERRECKEAKCMEAVDEKEVIEAIRNVSNQSSIHHS